MYGLFLTFICNMYRMSETDIYLYLHVSHMIFTVYFSSPLFWNCTTKALIWVHKHCCPPSVDPEMTRGHINNQTFLFAEYDDECRAVCVALQPPYLTIQMWASLPTRLFIMLRESVKARLTGSSLVSCYNYDSHRCVSVCARGMVFFLIELDWHLNNSQWLCWL